MLNSLIRSLRVRPQTPLITTTRFSQTASGGSSNTHNKMKQSESQSKSKTGDMSSLGEGYASRSKEEGFGGIEGDNQNLSKEDKDKIIHGESQGQQVKEKKKAD